MCLKLNFLKLNLILMHFWLEEIQLKEDQNL